jgi:hypothetical protein
VGSICSGNDSHVTLSTRTLWVMSPFISVGYGVGIPLMIPFMMSSLILAYSPCDM